MRPFFVALALLILVPVWGISTAQIVRAQAQTLLPNTPVEGVIANAGDSQMWQFTAQEGAMISLRAHGLTNNLDPVITVSNASGTVLITNDDYAYPNTLDALLQGITIPRIGTYTVTVSGFGTTSGTYRLMLTHGYADTLTLPAFDDPENLWSASMNALDLTPESDAVTLEFPIPDRAGYAVGEASPELEDFYLRARVNTAGRNGWVTGFTLRDTEAGRYVLMVNQRGQWRLQFINPDNTRRTIRDWTNHPAIPAGETSFTLGVLVNGRGFDVFYNDAYVGQAVDTQADIPLRGRAGFWLESPEALNSTARARFSDYTVNVPVRLNDGSEILPERLMSGTLGLTIQELERRQVIPVGGVQALNVPESSGRELGAGVNRVILGRGATFGEMVLSTTFTVQGQNNAPVGCGVLFGNTSDTRHTVAFLDASGAYGLSLRDGAEYRPGLFGESDAPEWTQGRQHLLVVRLTDEVHYYVNRVHVGSLPLTVTVGEVGNVVVNYQASDTICDFRDTWAWRLD